MLFADRRDAGRRLADRLRRPYWPARVASARLLLEKYNQSGATDELNSAIAINANANPVTHTMLVNNNQCYSIGLVVGRSGALLASCAARGR